MVQIQRDPNQGKIAYGSVAPFNVMHGEVRSGQVYTGMVKSKLKEELKK